VDGAGERESVRRLPVVALLFKGWVFGEGLRLPLLGCGPGERDCVREVVPLMPSSPTVACLRSSINVHKPSRKSEAIFLPVLSRTSRGIPRSMASFAVRTTSVVKSASVGTRVGRGGRDVSGSGRRGACWRSGGERMASGDNKDKARAWREPEKTVLFEFLLPLSRALRRSMSCCREAATTWGVSRVACRDCILCTLRGSCCRFLCASWAAHDCLRRCSSCSALINSSLSSSTRRS
jgi:hypothetical protein